MAEDDLTPLLLAAGVGLYLLTRPPRNPNGSASGTPPKKDGGLSTEAAVGGAICAAGAAYAGAGPALTGLAGAACAKIAPAVVDGIEYGAGKLAEGGSAVGKFWEKTPAGKLAIPALQGGYQLTKNVLNDPTGTVGSLFGFGGAKASPEAIQEWREARGVGDCGGWRGESNCPTLPPIAETLRNRAFGLGNDTPPPAPAAPAKKPAATKPLGFR